MALGPFTAVPMPLLTLIELILANVILSIALIGIYSVFDRAVALETRTTAAMQDYATARHIVEMIAADLEQAVNIADTDAIAGRQGEDKEGLVLTYLVGGATGELSGGGRATMQMRRYTWRPGKSEKTGGTLVLQVLAYAGSQILLPDAQSAQRLQSAEERIWDTLPQTVIAKNVAAISMRYRDP